MVKGMKLNVHTSSNLPDQFQVALNSGMTFLVLDDSPKAT